MRKIEQIIAEYCNECNERIRSINVEIENEGEYELCFSCEIKQLEDKQKRCKHNMEFYEFSWMSSGKLNFAFKCEKCDKRKNKKEYLSYTTQNKIGKLILDNLQEINK